MNGARHAVLTAVGRDRPGIVAGVTRVLYEQGCNLEDSAMTRLEGEFAIILIVQVPGEVSLDALRAAFGVVAETLSLSIHLKDMDEAEAAPSGDGAAAETHIISLYGADRPGIVYRVAELLARRGVNIVDVVTHRSPEGATVALYQLGLEVELPPGLAASEVQAEIETLGRELGVDVTMRPMETVEL